MRLKKYLILFLLAITIKIQAGSVPVGLTSDNIFAWSVWENDKGVLKHYLYVFNKTKKEIKLQIKLKKFKPAGKEFKEIKMDKEIYKTFLAPSRITKLDYPASSDRMSYMGFVEDGKPVGILSFNLEEPLRASMENKYKFYSNEGITSKLPFWIGFESIYDAKTEIKILNNSKNTGALFVKFTKSPNEETLFKTKADSLQALDKSIQKLDQTAPNQTVRLQGNLGQDKFVFIPLTIVQMENGKVISAADNQIPVFKE